MAMLVLSIASTKPVPIPRPSCQQESLRSPTSIVFAVDVTQSVPRRGFRLPAQRAFAGALYRVANRPGGSIVVFVRKINRNPFLDSARAATYYIPPARPRLDCGVQLGGKCTNANAQIERQQYVRHVCASRASSSIATLNLGNDSRTRIRGAFAVAGEILRSRPGRRWLIAATDLQPASVSPRKPERLSLKGVRVQIIVSCPDNGARCQSRQRRWKRLLLRTAVSVQMLNLSNADMLFLLP
jgi:hypothetical protein